MLPSFLSQLSISISRMAIFRTSLVIVSLLHNLKKKITHQGSMNGYNHLTPLRSQQTIVESHA